MHHRSMGHKGGPAERYDVGPTVERGMPHDKHAAHPRASLTRHLLG